LKDPPTIIRDNQTLSICYQQLKKDDIIYGRIRLKPGEEHVLTDLLERGIRLIPSAISQLASRSKTFQARIFGDFMLPDTLPVYDSHALLSATTTYRKKQYSRVILKHDRKNAGLGIHTFNDIEELYNYVSIGSLFFPFVIQPYHEKSRDIRVIILGDYVEAYERINPHNIRNNLHCGGNSTPYELPYQQFKLCKKVMQRGNFPYAHLDLILSPNGDCHLMEINLRGGLKGAIISADNYRERLEIINEKLLKRLSASERRQKDSIT
jgi:glutathione synthase/RimK-type ligase-like ATP-grasp enzyme